MKKIQYLDVSPVRSSIMFFVEYIRVLCDANNNPDKIVMTCAIDGERANGQLELSMFFPVYTNYPSNDYNYIKNKLASGDPFVTVLIYKCDCYYNSENNTYYGFADTFIPVTHDDVMNYIDEEAIL